MVFHVEGPMQLSNPCHHLLLCLRVRASRDPGRSDTLSSFCHLANITVAHAKIDDELRHVVAQVAMEPVDEPSRLRPYCAVDSIVIDVPPNFAALISPSVVRLVVARKQSFQMATVCSQPSDLKRGDAHKMKPQGLTIT